MFQVVVTLLLVWALFSWGAPIFDAYCIVGRISGSQAQSLNDLARFPHHGWDKCVGGLSECVAKEGDRVIRKECSEVLRTIQLRGN